jgi:Na+/proline symporter
MLGAPLFGVYLLGVLHPRCTGSGALFALFAGMFAGVGLCYNYQINYNGMSTVGSDVADCLPYFCTRRSSFEGCQLVNISSQLIGSSSSNPLYTLNETTAFSYNQTIVLNALQKLRKPPKSWPLNWKFDFLKHISYHMGGVVTLLVTIATGSAVSLCTKSTKTRAEIDAYLTPFLRQCSKAPEVIPETKVTTPIDKFGLKSKSDKNRMKYLSPTLKGQRQTKV